MLTAWSQERDQNISKTCVFIFHNSIQHDEASDYTFYNDIQRVCLLLIANSRVSTCKMFSVWNTGFYVKRDFRLKGIEYPLVKVDGKHNLQFLFNAFVSFAEDDFLV